MDKKLDFSTENRRKPVSKHWKTLPPWSNKMTSKLSQCMQIPILPNSCRWTKLLYNPSACSSWSWVPAWTNWPRSITKIRSARSTVDNRWAIRITVWPAKFWYRACWTRNSDSASSAEVASSNSKIFGFRINARAMATLSIQWFINKSEHTYILIKNIAVKFRNSRRKILKFSKLHAYLANV